MNDPRNYDVKHNRPKVLLMPNREVRRVPMDWEHPNDKDEQPIPLFARDKATIAELSQDGCTEEEILTKFMPDFSSVPNNQMGLAVYETTTEGTPLSTVFPDSEAGRIALVRYCATHVPAFGYYYAHPRTWAQVLFSEDLIVFDAIAGRFARAASRKES